MNMDAEHEQTQEVDTTNTVVLEAVRELTKAVADMRKEFGKMAQQIELSRKAGKF